MSYRMLLYLLLTVGLSLGCQLILFGKAVNFVHLAITSNTNEYYTTLNHPILNNNPDVMVFVTAHCEGCEQTVNPVGVYYNGTHWMIFRQDQASILYQTFNVVIYPKDYANTLTHTIQAANTTKYLSVLRHPLLDNQPDALLFTTVKKDQSGIYCLSPIRIYYSNLLQRWCLLNTNYTSFPTNLKINILIHPPQAQRISLTPEHATKPSLYRPQLKGKQSYWQQKIILTQTCSTTGPALVGIKEEDEISLLCLPRTARLGTGIPLHVYLENNLQ